MTSKKVTDNVLGGLWIENSNGVIAGASATDDGEFSITYSNGRMPPHSSEVFQALEELEARMREIEPDLRRWRLVDYS